VINAPLLYLPAFNMIFCQITTMIFNLMAATSMSAERASVKKECAQNAYYACVHLTINKAGVVRSILHGIIIGKQHPKLITHITRDS
jgi:hypothetical protein